MLQNILFMLMALSSAQEPTPTFRLHTATEPTSLDPAQNTSPESSYVYYNLYRGLFSVTEKGELKHEGAKSCIWKNALKLECELQENLKWSNGETLTAQNYILAFRSLFKKGVNPQALELIGNIKNAKAIMKGLQAKEKLGIQENAGKLLFDFKDPDPEFLLKLASPLLVPIYSEKFASRAKARDGVFNGPFKVESWRIGKRLVLVPNPHSQIVPKVSVEFLFIEDDETALNLYQQGELSYLRRLPTTLISQFKGKKDFHQLPIARFDYFGFSPELKKKLKLREALIYALDYAQLEKILDARGRPGCVGLPREWLESDLCVNFDLKKAKASFNKLTPEEKNKRWSVYYSQAGGDDHKKTVEWMQAQWKKNLGVQVDLRPMETRQLQASLKKGRLDIFRKGLGLDRPTCLSALENFRESSPENYIQLKSSDYESYVRILETAKTDAKRKRFCTLATRLLLDQHMIIPTGRIHFTVLADPRFTGWTLNLLNQLDLSRLNYTP